MKKLLLKISTCLLMLVCIVSATACGSKNAPLLDFEKARANLKEKGYAVSIYDYETGSDPDAYYGELEYFYAYSEDDERIEISRFKNKELAKKYYQQEKAEAEQEIKTLKAEIEYYEAALKHCKNELDSEEIEFLQCFSAAS